MNSLTSRFDFIKQIFGSIRIARDGVNVAVKCPSCKHVKKKFSINTETWNCHCWVCDLKGKTLLPILRKYFNSDIANEYQDKFLGSSDKHISIQSMQTDIELPSGFLLIADNIGSRDPDVKESIRYLLKRGLNYNDMWRFRFGTSKLGKFRRRIIFPSFDEDGTLNYFVARSIDDTVSPKYINAHVKKSDIIFNEIYIDWSKSLVITEGPFDLVKCGSNATCLLGSSLNSNSYLFKRIIANNTPTILALDRDMKTKSLKIAKSLSEYCCDVSIVFLSDHNDAGEMTKLEFKSSLLESKKFNRMNMLLHRIESIDSGSLI